MRKLILLLALFFSTTILLHAQEEYADYTESLNEFQDYYYTGTLGKNSIELYMYSFVEGCTGSTAYMAIYRYDKSKNWINLNVSRDKNSNLVMIEGFDHSTTGVLFLEMTEKKLEGIWLSPDARKKYKVQLNYRYIPISRKEELINKSWEFQGDC